MIFDVNQTEFKSEYQRLIWQAGTHIVPLEISLVDIDDEETREGCKQIYDCIVEILMDMYNNSDEYTERPRWYTCDYIAWLTNGDKPMKKHANEYNRYLQTIHKFGFEYDETIGCWSNERYPLLFEYYPRFSVLFKERKKNLGGYTDRLDFRLFAKRISLSFDDILRPLSFMEQAYATKLHNYAISKGMKMEIKSPYSSRYIYKKLYSLEIHNLPFKVEVVYRLSNGGHIHDELERLLKIVERQEDKDEIIKYIQGGICVCNACNGIKKANQRCGKWIDINGERRLASMCHPAISKYRRGKDISYTDYDIEMMKRMIDIRVVQIDEYLEG